MAVSTRLAKGSPCLAVPAAYGVPGGHHRHHHPYGVVHHFERSSGGTGEPELNDEPGEGTLVFPRATGNAGLLRPVDCWRGYAHADYFRPHGHSVHRYESSRLRLLHLEAAQVCDLHISLRICHFVGLDDCHRYIHPRARLAMVLARADLGPQPPDL